MVKTQTTKDAEALAKELTSDIYNPPMLHGGFDDAPEVDWPTLIATVKAKLLSALTAEYERGKADVVPSGDARDVRREIMELWGVTSARLSSADEIIQIALDAARAEGERIGFERGKNEASFWKSICSIPDGWQLVPKILTNDMILAFNASSDDEIDGYVETQVGYTAMLAAAPPAPERAQQWQPIETAPKEGTPIMAFFPQASFEPTLEPICLVINWASWGNWAIPHTTDDGDMGDWQPTHWMPLPAAPSPASKRSDELLQDSGPQD